MTIYLYEFSARNIDTGTVETLRFSSSPYITLKSDSPSSTRYDDRVSDRGGSFDRWMFQDGSTFGRSAIGVGEITLQNADGALDVYRAYGFDNRTLTIKTVENKQSAYSTAVVFATLTVEAVEFNLQQVSFAVRDPLYLLEQSAQTATFAGTNSGSSDLEGTPTTLQGKRKPFFYGKIYRVEPPMVNHTSLIYGLNFDSTGAAMAIQSVEAVYDGENPLTLDTSVGTGGNTTTAALLASATIAAGKYATCTALGLVRVNTRPTFALTVDASEGTNAAARTMGQCVKRLLTDRAGITNFDTSSLTALDSANSSVVGVYCEGDDSIIDLVAALLEGDAAFCLPKINGQWVFGRLIDPTSGTSTATIGENTSLDEASGFQRQPLNDPQGGIPAWKTIVNYSRYWRTLGDTEVAGAVSEVNKAAAQESYRSTSTEDAAVKTQYLSAPIHEINSLFTAKADADTAAARLQAIRGTLRDLWIVPVQTDLPLEVGSVITLQYRRYGLNAGKKGLIIGYNIPSITSGIVEYGVLI